MTAPNRFHKAYLGAFTNGDYTKIVTNAITTLDKKGKLGLISKISDSSVTSQRIKEFKSLGLNIPKNMEDGFFDFDQSDQDKIAELIKRIIALFKSVVYIESSGFFSSPPKPYSLDQVVRIEHTVANDKYKEANPSTTLAAGSDYNTYELAFKENPLAAIGSTSFGMFQIIPIGYQPNEQGFKDLINGSDLNLSNWGNLGTEKNWNLLLGTDKIQDVFSTIGDDISNAAGFWDTVTNTIFSKFSTYLTQLTFSSSKINWNLYSLATIVGRYFFMNFNNKTELSKLISSLWHIYVPTMYVFWGAPANIGSIKLNEYLYKWPENYHGLHPGSSKFKDSFSKMNMSQDIKGVVDSGQWPKVGYHDGFGDCCSYNSQLLYAFIQFYNNPDLLTLNPSQNYSNYGGGDQHIITTVYTYMGAKGKVMRDSLTQKLTSPMFATTIDKKESDLNNEIKNKIMESIYSHINKKDFDSSKNLKLDISNNVILPLNITITIDGISGLNIGDPIELDFLPKIYSDNTYLIITGLSYEITSGNNWSTNMSLAVKLKGQKDD